MNKVVYVVVDSNNLRLLFLRQFETINPTIIDNSGVYDLLARKLAEIL